MNKINKMAIYVIGALIVGFLISFYYQTTLVLAMNPFSTNYSFYSDDNADQESFILLKGWQRKKSNDDHYASMKQQRALFIVNIPEKDGILLEFRYRSKDPDQVAEVYSQEQLLGVLEPSKDNEWKQARVTMDSALVKEGLNIIYLMKDKPSAMDFESVNVSNYKTRKLVFMRCYVLWETTKWFNKRGDISVDWNLCFYTGLIFLCIWLAYARFFWLFTKEKYSLIAYLDFSSYLPAVIYFSILFLASKFISSYTFIYYKTDFIISSGFLVSIGKIYQIIHYGKKDMVALRFRQFKHFIKYKFDVIATILIIIYALIMLACAVLLILDERAKAEILCNNGFFVLIAGVVIKIFKYFFHKEYLLEDES